MRKTSSQILHEFLLEKELDRLPIEERERLDKYLDDMVAGRVNELEALTNLIEFSGRSETLNEYIQSKIVERAKYIMAELGGLTIEQFEQKIKDLEKEHGKYGAIRNSTRSTVH